MRRMSVAVVAAVAWQAVVPASSQAWNKPGHMVTGAVAYKVLQKQDPQALQKVVKLLKQHPAYAQRWREMIHKPYVPAQDRDLYLFMLAARWPDDARGDETYYPPNEHRDRLHYINLPYKPEGQPASVRTRPPDDINILRGYERFLAEVKGDSDDAQKAVSLAWIFHLVGDVHQPLHTTSLFSTEFPEGDRGGTRFYIKPTKERSAISLHAYWDGLLGGSDRFTTTRNRASALLARPEFAREKLKELSEKSFEKWARNESFPLARTAAYRDVKGSRTKSDARPLPEGYAKTAQATAERRVVLAGYRLADVLQQTFD